MSYLASGGFRGIVGLSCVAVMMSCGCWLAPPPDEPEWLISVGDVTTVTGAEVIAAHDATLAANGGVATSENELVGGGYEEWIELLRKITPIILECRKITYWGRDANDQKTVMTGMLFLPRPGLFEPRPYSVPLIAYPHGTELKRALVPSNLDGDEWVFGAAASMIGRCAVAMPDLPGMGGADPNRYHPYCHATSLAYSVVDMVRAVKEAFERELRWSHRWNGRLHILGYSEGGYAAMATVKELQLNAANYPGLSITNSACLAGPHDLTGAMRKMMIDPNLHFSRPYFLPYMIYGYSAIYGGYLDPNLAMRSVLMPDLTQWANGSMTGDDVDTLIEQRMGVAKGQVIPRELMEPNWVAQQLEDSTYQTSPVGQILAANNLWSGWAPNRPMLIRHSPDDDCVPYANSVKIYEEFLKAGAGDYLTFRPIGKPGDGIGHVTGAMYGIPTGIMWLLDKCTGK